MGSIVIALIVFACTIAGVLHGREAKDVWDMLRHSVAAAIERIWPAEKIRGVDMAAAETATGLEGVYQGVQTLSLKTDAQRSLQAQALQISGDLLQARWLLIEQTQSSVPTVFLVILVFWLTVFYASFGLFALRNATAVVALLLVSTAALCGVLADDVSARGFAGLYAGQGSIRYSQQVRENCNATGPYAGGANRRGRATA